MDRVKFKLEIVKALSASPPTNKSILTDYEDLLGNEVADDLAKAATSNPVDSEDHMVLTSTEIYSRAKELICRTWVVPPLHPWYFQRHPGSAISFKGSRSYQTVFSRFSTGHLRCMNFEGGKKASQFAPNVTSVLFLLSTVCNVWGFPVRRLLHPPAVLRLCTNLWTHGSGLVKLDQMGISPTTTTRYKKIALSL
ncbi:uncharacterized protein TNCV_2272861 [Trichonephila clavipes]|nr:uncharacterized protein TNCV_2272861 [Trichonephila clavipes]